MTLNELYVRLGELLAEHGDQEVALNYPHEVALYRVTGASLYTRRDPHGHPTFMQLHVRVWDEREQQEAV